MASFLENMLRLNLSRSVPKERVIEEPDFNPFQEGAFSPALNKAADFGQDIKQGGFNILDKLGTITGLDGSPAWAHGLDIDLQKGQPVPNAVSGTVDFVGERGGFGNQVRIKGDDGNTYWYSHLDMPQVKVGQRIGAGQNLGLGGNTGYTIPGPGGDGSHLDLTALDPQGRYIAPRKLAEMLRTFNPFS